MHLLNHDNKVANLEDHCSKALTNIGPDYTMFPQCEPGGCLYTSRAAPPCLCVWGNYSDPATCCEVCLTQSTKTFPNPGAAHCCHNFQALDFLLIDNRKIPGRYILGRHLLHSVNVWKLCISLFFLLLPPTSPAHNIILRVEVVIDSSSYQMSQSVINAQYRLFNEIMYERTQNGESYKITYYSLFLPLLSP